MPVQSQQQQRKRSASDPFSDPLNSVSAPPVPPKPSQKYQRDTSMEIIRDAVTIRNQDSPRTRIARSQTQNIVPASNGRPGGHTPRRSLSEDSAGLITTFPVEKNKAKRTGKKGSVHADVIDRLDFSGVGPMFHHDGPFDACAPSRNRHRTKAPMAALTGPPEEPDVNDSNAALEETYYAELPRRDVDAIAQAWGIHEPEPFQDFSAGGGQSNDRYQYSPANTVKKNGYDDSRQQSSRPRANLSRAAVPPPQPIFVPDPAEVVDSSPPPQSSPGLGGVKRSKSLMHRIRKMRETPNVPLGNEPVDLYGPPSPGEISSNSRPTHRSQNSFLGRFGGRSGTSPTEGESQSYVYVKDPKNKELPQPPPPGSSGESSESGVGGYFDGNNASFSSSPSHGRLVRKQSLLKKVGKAFQK